MFLTIVTFGCDRLVNENIMFAFFSNTLISKRDLLALLYVQSTRLFKAYISVYQNSASLVI